MAVRSTIIAVVCGFLAFAGVHRSCAFFLIVVGGPMSAIGFLGLGEYLFARRFIELGETELVLPDGFLRRDRKRISYAEIEQMWEKPFENSVILYLVSAADTGKIFVEMLPNAASYEAVRDFIYTRATGLRSRYDLHDPPIEMTWIWEEFPKPIFSWKEPEIYPRYRTRLVTRKPLWWRVGRSLIFFGIWYLPGYLLLSLLRFPVATYMATAIPVAFFLTLVNWMHFHHPARCSRISLYEEKIGFLSGKQSGSTRYCDIAAWRMIERQDRDGAIHLLIIQYPKHVFTWAIPDTETRDQVARVLGKKLGPQSGDLRPEWE